jgi:L-aspartate oxidase
MEVIRTDCLIIGTGLAGLATAIELAKSGIDTILVTRTEKAEISSTYYAQGGIIYKSGNGNDESLARDIMAAGDNICDPRSIEILVKWGPKLVDEILIGEIGVAFDRVPKGPLDLTEEGGHSVPRIIHVGDYTGRAIEEKFIEHLIKRYKLQLLKNSTALDLLTLSHHSTNPLDIYKEPTCLGAYVYRQEKKDVVAIIAKETVLATGGLGQIYLHTSNPEGARGDGYSMANRAGAQILNMEYVQFHPTTLYLKQTAERFLISESLRGEGAKLLNRSGNEFMDSYHEQGSLAPRDIVARSIHEEMLKDGADYLYLDISFKPASWIKNRFPNIYRKCLENGVDITTSPIPIVPAAHYSCGGVVVDEFGHTSIMNLRALGEVSCTGLHGANRLASTSLLEDLVWGIRAGRDISSRISKNSFYIPSIKEWRYEREEVDPALIRQDWLMIKQTMWNYVGLVRTFKRLERARSILTELEWEIESFYAKGEISDPLIGLRNGIRAANVVLNSARRNRISKGCHFIKN